jgi:hypothetical protein
VPQQSEIRDWPTLLAALEASVAARQSTLFDDEAPLPRDLILPTSLPAIPAEHGMRARAVLEALDAQEELLTNELARLRVELARLTRAESSGPRRAVHQRPGGFEALA